MTKQVFIFLLLLESFFPLSAQVVISDLSYSFPMWQCDSVFYDVLEVSFEVSDCFAIGYIYFSYGGNNRNGELLKKTYNIGFSNHKSDLLEKKQTAWSLKLYPDIVFSDFDSRSCIVTLRCDIVDIECCLLNFLRVYVSDNEGRYSNELFLVF